MKRFVLAALLALSVPTTVNSPRDWFERGTQPEYTVAAPPATKADRLAYIRVQRERNAARAYILRVNKGVDARRASLLAIAITDEARAHKFPWRMFAAVLAQESHFYPDLNACHGQSEPNCDEGVGQVNWPTWHRALSLDRQRLIHDDAYNIAVAAEIMGRLRFAFAASEENWWSRYHDYRTEYREPYETLVAGLL